MAKPDMIGFVVREMAAALAFYRLMGLDIPNGAEREDHVECEINGYRMAWDTVKLVESFSGPFEAPSGHRMSMAFLCDSPADVDATYNKIIAAGYTSRKAPWDAFWGQRYATVEDPEGNPVDLFAPLKN